MKLRLPIAALGSIVLTLNIQAANVAVFGDNDIDNYIATLGHSVTLVSDAQLATPGFLSGFSAFVMTRPGSTFGGGLTPAAAANVNAYVGATGNVVLLNGDFADGVLAGGSIEQKLIGNSVTFAIASGHGFVGEFNGAVSGLTANSDGFNPIGLISGSAGPLGGGNGGSADSIFVTPAGVGSPVLAGVGLPGNPNGVEFGSAITGVNSALVVATYSSTTGLPAVIVRTGSAPGVPDAGTTLSLFSLGLCALAGFRRMFRS